MARIDRSIRSPSVGAEERTPAPPTSRYPSPLYIQKGPVVGSSEAIGSSTGQFSGYYNPSRY